MAKSARASPVPMSIFRMSSVQIMFSVFSFSLLQRYHDAVAQTIFQSFYILYPKSRSFLSEEVKLKLLDMLGHWTNGMWLLASALIRQYSLRC